MPKQALSVLATDCCAGQAITEPMNEAAAANLAPAFKALGDPIRLRLLALIAAGAGSEVCVCDLTAPFNVSGPTISHHLKALRNAGLIDCQRRGTWVYYWIIPARLSQLSMLLDPHAEEATKTS